jgi:hypothetical protein
MPGPPRKLGLREDDPFLEALGAPPVPAGQVSQDLDDRVPGGPEHFQIAVGEKIAFVEDRVDLAIVVGDDTWSVARGDDALGAGPAGRSCASWGLRLLLRRMLRL